ncbi:MAG TPA: tetratricopeptide repeat protein, partial [Pirellulales bacterium]
MSTAIAKPPATRSERPSVEEKPRPSGWILSPLADAVVFLALPLLVWPLAVAASQVWSAETVVLAALAFASLGHHLPGFLRAYGDRDLFQRFYWRFLLAPPAIFAICLAFELNALHGVRLLVLLWATWHGMMQTYGFLRIYDLKRGRGDALDARLDWLLCVAMFVAGAVFSDARMYYFVQAFWQAGGPAFAEDWLIGGRWAVGLATTVVVGTYLIRQFQGFQHGRGLNLPKMIFAAGTGWLWWICGAAGTNVLVGIAMFEIVHAVQYAAVVWTYNRKAAARRPVRSGLDFLFGDGWLRPILYVALIAGFGSLRYVIGGLTEPQAAWFSAGAAAVLACSTILHYYFDGFIWKVREPESRANLGLSPTEAAAASSSGWKHLAAWGGFVAPAALLGWLEWSAAPEIRQARADEATRTLAAWTPDLPESQLALAEMELRQGNAKAARAAIEKAVALRPDWPTAQAILGNACEAMNDPKTAAKAYTKAAQLDPGKAGYRYNLAGVLRDLKDYPGAEREYLAALAIEPNLTDAQVDLGSLYGLWGHELATTGDPLTAIKYGKLGLERRPDWALLWFNLGAWQMVVREGKDSLASLRKSVELDPNFGQARLTLAHACWDEAGPWMALR